MVSIVSPHTHLAGHYAAYTLQIVSAYKRAKGHAPKTFTALPFSVDQTTSTIACAPWTQLLASIRYRNQHWGSTYDTVLRNVEFVLCLKRAIREGGSAHIYCLDARHQSFFYFLRRTSNTFSHLCLGGPNPNDSVHRRELYRQAFATNRLTFIVETEETRRQWEPIAGHHVVHIPVAIESPSTALPSKTEARRLLGLPENRLICLFFGTHREGKDYRSAIAAAQAAPSKPFLVFAGPLISPNDPERFLGELNFGDALVWKRNYAEGEEAPLFAACDAVVLPYAEGYTKGSAVLLQACKYERPIIATETGHLAEFVRRHDTGLLFKAASIESLAQCYDGIRDWFTVEKVANLQKVKTRFTWDAMIKEYLNVFNENRCLPINITFDPSKL
jgi:glycosyltransferase involved in cell wall biosynthesis